VDQSGEVLVNRNVPNGAQPILKVIGGLPLGTPAAFEAAPAHRRRACRSLATRRRTRGPQDAHSR
jgi:hypothetical protein